MSCSLQLTFNWCSKKIYIWRERLSKCGQILTVIKQNDFQTPHSSASPPQNVFLIFQTTLCTLISNNNYHFLSMYYIACASTRHFTYIIYNSSNNLSQWIFLYSSYRKEKDSAQSGNSLVFWPLLKSNSKADTLPIASCCSLNCIQYSRNSLESKCYTHTTHVPLQNFICMCVYISLEIRSAFGKSLLSKPQFLDL